jgi:hypothetical protein
MTKHGDRSSIPLKLTVAQLIVLARAASATMGRPS